ncbi:MAG: CRTAC1 family protein [Bryobacteraceae bacterium]
MGVAAVKSLFPTALGLMALISLPYAGAESSGSPIRFRHQAIPFTLNNGETPQKHLPGTMAGGVAIFDFDNDGHLDIYFTNGGDLATLKKSGPRFYNRLFRGDGKGGFEDVTERAGVAGTGYDIGVTVGDYDNDGHRDLFVAGVHRNTLYRNNGDGTFRDVTAEANLMAEAGAWAVGAAWFDYDRDGHLDLFVVNYVRWQYDKDRTCVVNGKPDYCHPRFYEAAPNALYRNNGDGTFTDVSEEAGIRAHLGKGMGIGVADFDGDGWPDVFIANDRVFNFFFRNTGKGTFIEAAFDAGVAVPQDGSPVSAMGVDARDMDNDGRPDLIFTALADETFPLFRNVGKGQMEEVTASSQLARLTRKMAGWSAGFFDFDNDGWKDLFVTRSDALSPAGGKGERTKEPNSVFRNLGKGRFADLSEAAGLAARPPQMYRGAAFGDFNGDGRIDVVVSALNAEAEAWINEGAEGGHWIAVALEGTRSNRDGIGVRIRVKTDSGVQYNHATTAAGYASSSAGPVHFGLGADAVVREMTVEWPSGRVQTLAEIPAGQVLRVKEPAE